MKPEDLSEDALRLVHYVRGSSPSFYTGLMNALEEAREEKAFIRQGMSWVKEVRDEAQDLLARLRNLEHWSRAYRPVETRSRRTRIPCGSQKG